MRFLVFTITIILSVSLWSADGGYVVESDQSTVITVHTRSVAPSMEKKNIASSMASSDAGAMPGGGWIMTTPEFPTPTQAEASQSVETRFILGMLIIAAVVLVVVLRILYFTNKKNKIIVQQNERINEIIDELKQKNDDMTSSIRYAKNFQTSIALRESSIRSIFPDSFVYYKPKDIVSGDLPFMMESGQFAYVGCIDCVGHGVPGAMLTFITYFNLRNLIVEFPNASSGQLLSLLHERITSDLASEIQSKQVRVSVDMSLCRIHKPTGRACFAGAQQGLLLQLSTHLKYMRGDRYSLCDGDPNSTPLFTTHEIQFQPGQRMFMFSDGIVHQFDSSSKKKFAFKRLKEILDTNHALSNLGLKSIIEQTIQKWKGLNAQTDDMLVIGITPLKRMNQNNE